ncbi:MAG: diadenylate cyclase [Planctomycetes bacterium]|nr:diadenylate cyclase [Planctomycetota bacterium]
MLDTLNRLFAGLGSAAHDPFPVAIELALIGLAINWCVGKLQGTRGTRPLRGLLIVLLVATLVVRVLAAQMDWARLVLLYDYFVVALAFIALTGFQPELRRAFLRAGDVPVLGGLRRGAPQSKLVGALVKSAGYLSRNRYGGLIAIRRSVDLRGWAENGTTINGEVSANLLNTIFFPNSALHDLGVIIQGNKLLAANCQFPQAESDDVDSALGSRHLAAVGMSYESDALVLVVSEETGTISLADNGRLTRFLALDELEEELLTRLSGKTPATQNPRRASGWHVAWRVVRRFLLVVPLTLVIWYLAYQASQIEAPGVKLVLGITHETPARVVDVMQPQPARFSVTFRGSAREIRALRDESAGGPLRLNWMLSGDYDQPDRYTLSARAIIENLPTIRERGVTVEKVVPETLTFDVDKVVTVAMPVRVESGSIRVAGVRCDPAEALVTLRSGDLARLLVEQRTVTAIVEERLREAHPGETLALDRVRLQLAVGGVEALRVEPATTNVALRVVGQQVRRRVPSVAVRYSISPQLVSRYGIELRDPNEMLIEVEVEGDKALVDALQAQDLRAFVRIDSSLEPPSLEFRPIPITLLPPEGIAVVSPLPSVHLRLVDHQVGTP